MADGDFPAEMFISGEIFIIFFLFFKVKNKSRNPFTSQ